MRCHSLSLVALLASLCLVQGAPLVNGLTPGLPPLLQQPYSVSATKKCTAKATTITTTSTKSTSTSKATSTTKNVESASATKKCTAKTTTTSTTHTITSSTKSASTAKVTANPSSESSKTEKKSCFPALNFTMPSKVPNSLDGWWCSQETEYAFLGFSYEISACQSQSKLNRDFLDARKTFNSRYIRLYGACDEAGYYDKVIEAAWNAGLGVQALIWFGFDGDDSWKARKKDLFNSLMTNPKAPFVTRGLQFGSEPLFDWAIDPKALAVQVTKAKATLSALKIPVTVSDLAWGFQSTIDDGSMEVLKAIDYVGLHMLPYFAPNAQTGSHAWGNNMYDMNQILGYTNSSKKIIWTENGWPSKHYCPGVCPNSPTAVSSVKSEKAYYKLLDDKCTSLKQFPKGGVGWFAHIYSDTQEPGYGIYDTNGNMKFNFAPKTSC